MARNHIREFYEAGGYVKPTESREQKRRRIDQALYGASQWGRPKMAHGGFLDDILGTVGGLAGNLIPIPFVGPMLGKMAGQTLGNVIQGSPQDIGYDFAGDVPFVGGMIQQGLDQGQQAARGGRIGFAERGFVTNLMKRIAGSQGRAAGRRVEQAADSVDLSRYMPSALDEVFDKRNPGLLTTMRPSEFENYAYPLPQKWIDQTPYRGSGAGTMEFPFPGNYNDYINSLKNVAEGGGFEQTPALWFGQNKAKGLDDDYRLVVGHDGRHRMRALADMGDDPTLVNLLPQQPILGRSSAARRITPSWFGDQLFPEVMPQTYLPGNKSTWNPVELPQDLFADGGRVGFGVGGDAARVLRRYRDAPSKWIDDWKWRPVGDVAREMPTKLPEHIEPYGRFMQDMANVAGTEGLSPRDLQKAYLTTRMSMQRQAINPEILARAGLDVPMDQGLIRPEGAMSRFFGMPIGEKYLEQAGKGSVDPKLIEDASGMFRNFGKTEDARDMFEWAPRLAGQEGRTSELVDRAARGQGDPQEWVDHMLGIRGISPAKHGFYGSLLGYGDRPTLDARQIQLWTGQPTAESTRWTSKPYKAVEGVDRLAARQRALGMEMPEGLDPFYQHLTHHALWDTFGGDQTTHQDLIDSMLGRAEGGRIGMDKGGSLLRRILGSRGQGAFQKFSELPEQSLIEHYAKQTGKTPEELLEALRDKTTGVRNDTETIQGITSLKDPSLYQGNASVFFPNSGRVRNELTPEDLYRRYGGEGMWVQGMGDRTSAGPIVSSVGGMQVPGGMPMPGGPDFGRFHDEIWASDQGPLTGIVNSPRSALKATAKRAPIYNSTDPDAPLLFTNSLMGLQSGDQSHMVQQLASQAMREAPLSEATRTAFQERMAKLGLPNFPDPHDPELTEKLLAMPMADRRLMVQEMDKGKWNALGVPNPAMIRLATTDPHLITSAKGDVGRTIGEINRSSPFIKNPEIAHGSYPVGLQGEYLGGLGKPLRPQIAFPDWFKAYGKPGVDPSTDIDLMNAFLKSPALQKLDQQWLDQAQPFYEQTRGWQRGGRTAFGRGGRVDKRYHVPLFWGDDGGGWW